MKHTDEKVCKTCRQLLKTTTSFRKKAHRRGPYYTNVCRPCEKKATEHYRRNTWPGRAAEMYRRVQERAVKFNRPFNLTKEWITERLETINYTCEATGLPLELHSQGSGVGWRNRFSASLDRIDSSKGYTKDNVRIICNRMNTALGDLTDDQFEEFAIGFLRTRGFTIAKTPVSQ